MKVSMVDISDKKIVRRKAVSEGSIKLGKGTINKIKSGKIKKGDPLQVAEIAAINAIKKTPELIPLCHQIPIENIEVDFTTQENGIRVKTTVSATAKTGVEMEALVGTIMALTTLWDMVKYLEKDDKGQYPTTLIENVRVVKKEKDGSHSP